MPGTENSDGNGSLEAIGNRIGSMLAIVALGTYIVMVATFIAFVSSVLLLALVPALPPLVVALARKDKVLALRRGKAACWALGFVILVLFPAFWLIPDQVYRRVNRQSVLITPGAPAVVAMGQEFLETHPGYSSLPFDDKARLACTFTLEKVQWKLDLEIYGLSGHVATPSECLSAEADDCQGQAVTLASLLLYLGFEHAWAVETPFHWYVLVRDPARGALPAGWELDVESLQASGEVLALNRDGGGDMPPWRFEEVMLIFNDRETLFPVDALAAVGLSWTATAFFVDDVFPIFQSTDVIFFFMALVLVAIPVAAWTMYMAKVPPGAGTPSTREKGRKAIPRVLVAWAGLVAIFIAWYVLQPVMWDWTLVAAIVEIAAISLAMTERGPWTGGNTSLKPESPPPRA